MKLDKIIKIVSEEVNDTMPQEMVYSIAKEVKQEYPETKEDVLDALWCLNEDEDDDDFATFKELQELEADMDDDSGEEEEFEEDLE